jgi:formylglycine-generating enzyme required for sulfatase activity
MAVIPAGWFEMGSAAGQPDEAPVHKVWIDSFLMDTTEVTQDQYTALMVVNPSHFKGGSMPVEQIAWAKAAVFCNKRSEAEGLEPCYDEETAACNFSANGYRLPTEAEWEYACRAGTGPGESSLKEAAWFGENAAKTTHRVAEKKPNPWGLYDMLGNVAEWCNDAYGEHYYESSPDRNPRGPDAGKLYVLRGGAWNSRAEGCRPTYRAAENPGFQDACFARDTIGFRCVRRAPVPAE